jgi:hypothetical protein
MELASGAWDLDMSSRCLKILCTPVLQYSESSYGMSIES